MVVDLMVLDLQYVLLSALMWFLFVIVLLFVGYVELVFRHVHIRANMRRV